MITREKAELRSLMYAVIAVLLLAFAAAVHAGTKVEIHTNWDALILADHADFKPLQIEMFDDAATDPVNTVNNFLNYITSGSYDDMVFHRWVTGFVIQGGGSVISDVVDGQYYIHDIPSNGAIVNQFGRSNILGTLAMAKLGGDPDSATSEFFVNLNDNSIPNQDGDSLDNQNGGFTVFSQVVEETNSFTGMQIFDWLTEHRSSDSVFIWEDNTDPESYFAPLIITSIEIIEESTFNPSLNGEYGVQYVGNPDGDVNNDGVLNGFDVDPFVEYLLGGAYHAAADMNKDGLVNGFDVDPFVAALLGGGTAPESMEVPEPATMMLLGVGLVAMKRRRKA